MLKVKYWKQTKIYIGWENRTYLRNSSNQVTYLRKVPIVLMNLEEKQLSLF